MARDALDPDTIERLNARREDPRRVLAGCELDRVFAVYDELVGVGRSVEA